MTISGALQAHRLTGFVLLIPEAQGFLRLVVAKLTSVTFLVFLLVFRPYRRKDHDLIAVGAQLILTVVFLAASYIKLFEADGTPRLAGARRLARCPFSNPNSHAPPRPRRPTLAGMPEVMGFASADQIVGVMLCFNLALLGLVLAVLVQQYLAQRTVPTIRLQQTGEVPDLPQPPSITWHTFLSHIWGSGQDQVAVIKRQLLLLLPGVSVFLDVDDLKEIGALEEYVERTGVMLFFLSRGYFRSARWRTPKMTASGATPWPAQSDTTGLGVSVPHARLPPALQRTMAPKSLALPSSSPMPPLATTSATTSATVL